jgi:hypothetical protein
METTGTDRNWIAVVLSRGEHLTHLSEIFVRQGSNAIWIEAIPGNSQSDESFHVSVI